MPIYTILYVYIQIYIYINLQSTYLRAINVSSIILENLVEERTVHKDNFTNIFSYQVILVFCKISILLSLIRPTRGYSLSMKITGFIPLGQGQLCDLMFKVVTELCFYMIFLQLFLFLDLDSLFQDYLWIFILSLHIFYFIIIGST